MADYKITRALVTGGAGFVGGHVVAQLCEMGVKVRVLDLQTADLRNLKTLDVDFVAIWRAGETMRVEEDAATKKTGSLKTEKGSIAYEMRLSDPGREQDIVRKLEDRAMAFDLVETFERIRAAVSTLAATDPKFA